MANQMLQQRIGSIARRWISHHEGQSIPFEYIEFTDTLSYRAIAKVNLTSRILYISEETLFEMAKICGINFYVFTYYVMSHEQGHLLYKKTDQSMNEELFAHRFGYHDCIIRLGLYYSSDVLSRLEVIKDKLVLT